MIKTTSLHFQEVLAQFRRRAGFAAAISAVAAALAIVAVSAAVRTLNEDALAMERLGGQRMWAQRATALAFQLEAPDVSQTQHGRILTELTELRDVMRAEIRFLLNDPATPEDIAALLAVAWDGEAGVMARFDTALADILDGNGRAAALNHREAMLFTTEAARLYRRHLDQEVVMVGQVAFGAFTLILIGGGIVYYGVFRRALAALAGVGAMRAAAVDAVERGGIGFVLLNKDGATTYVNPCAERLLGYSNGGLSGVGWDELRYGGDPADPVGDVSKGGVWCGDVRLVDGAGALFWAEIVATAWGDQGGRLILLFAAGKRAEIEAELKQAQERLGAAIEAFDHGFALYDADERLLMCNRRYADLLPGVRPWLLPGASFADLVDRVWDMGLIATDQTKDEFLRARLAQYRAASGQSEQRLSDGRWVWTSERRTPEGGRVSLVADVTSLRAGQEQLQLALDKAQAGNQAKTAFLSSMSHELRTPLNAIIGFSQLLDATPNDVFGPKQRRSVAHILNAGHALGGLIDQILDLADLQSGGALDRSEFDLTPVIEECLDVARCHAVDKNVELSRDATRGATMVRGDRDRLIQALHCLLSNALKFNKAGGRVHVSVSPQPGGAIRIAVSDTGNGLPLGVDERPFQAFERLGRENSNVAGAGIGLAMAKTAVEMMGGRIGCCDDVGGTGAVFWIELPAAQPAQAA